MRSSRFTQLQQAQGASHFHLWSSVAPELAANALASAEVRTFAGKLLRRLSKAYAIKLEGFAFTANQIHLVLEWDPQAAEGWNDEELGMRWQLAFPRPQAESGMGPMSPMNGPMNGNGVGNIMGDDMLLAVTPTRLRGAAADAMSAMPAPVPFHARRLLGNLSSFLQRFKQLLTFKANQLLGRKGTLWQGRFQLASLADASAVAGAMAFIDLLPVGQGEGERPEEAAFTSLHARVALYKAKFGMPPYGPLGPPDGAWQPLPAEVTAELRDDTRANDYEAMEPPPEGGAAWVVGLQGDAHTSNNGVGFSFTLRKYLALLDQLVQKAQAWPHLPADAPGRALPEEPPVWESAVEQALTALGLVPARFEAQWGRLARLRG